MYERRQKKNRKKLRPQNEELELQRTEFEQKYKMEMQVLDDKLASEDKKLKWSKKEVLDIPEAKIC